MSRADLDGCPPMHALVNGVVFAVHREHRDAPPPGVIHHDRAGHDQDLFVGERNGLPAGDGFEDRVERRGARRSEQTTSASGCVATAISPSAPHAVLAGQRRASAPKSSLELGNAGSGRHGDRVGRVPGSLLDEPGNILSSRQCHDPQPIGMRGYDREGALSDRAGGSDDRDSLHEVWRYMTKT